MTVKTQVPSACIAKDMSCISYPPNTIHPQIFIFFPDFISS
jgi:hypothetical protein